jgi:hypothetical protein
MKWGSRGWGWGDSGTSAVWDKGPSLQVSGTEHMLGGFSAVSSQSCPGWEVDFDYDNDPVGWKELVS